MKLLNCGAYRGNPFGNYIEVFLAFRASGSLPVTFSSMLCGTIFSNFFSESLLQHGKKESWSLKVFNGRVKRADQVWNFLCRLSAHDF